MDVVSTRKNIEETAPATRNIVATAIADTVVVYCPCEPWERYLR